VNLVFDVDLNKLVTPNIDVSYQTYNEENIPLSIAFFTAPGSTSAYSKSDAQVIGAFGVSTNSDKLHRIWEFTIDLKEITKQNDLVRMGLNVHSWVPTIDDFKPPNYKNDFSNLIQISLANGTIPPGGTGNNNSGQPGQQQWWTRPEIFVPITVAIIASVIGPLVVSRYGKKHRSTDDTE